MRLLAASMTGLAVALLLAVGRGWRPSRRPARWEPSSRLQLAVAQAGLSLSVGQVRVLAAGLGCIVFVLIASLTAAPIVAVVPGLAVGALVPATVLKRAERRLRDVHAAWPDAIRDLLASIHAGASLHQAVETLATDGPPALREPFERYPSLARVVGVVPALETVREGLADPTSDRVLEVLILAHERGGHILRDILRDLAEATNADLRVAEAIAGDQLEQKINARAVFVLPWLVLLALTLQDGVFRDFYRSTNGLVVVCVGLLASLGGMVWVNRLGRAEAEQRVVGTREVTS